MTAPDRPLFTAEIVGSSNPSLVALDIAEHQRIEKTPQEWSRLVGRERFWSRFDSIIGGLSMISGLGAFGWGVLNWATSGHLEPRSIIFGLTVPILLTGGRILLQRSSKLTQKTDAIEQALNFSNSPRG